MNPYFPAKIPKFDWQSMHGKTLRITVRLDRDLDTGKTTATTFGEDREGIIYLLDIAEARRVRPH